ncbi:hypothetical protein Tco_1452586 [Tanacetum coccineum]
MDSKEGLGGGGFVVLGGKSSRESKNTCEEEGGVEKMSSTGSKFIVMGDEYFEVEERHLELMEEPFGNRLEVIVFDMEGMPDEGILSLFVFLEGDG